MNNTTNSPQNTTPTADQDRLSTRAVTQRSTRTLAATLGGVVAAAALAVGVWAVSSASQSPAAGPTSSGFAPAAGGTGAPTPQELPDELGDANATPGPTPPATAAPTAPDTTPPGTEPDLGGTEPDVGGTEPDVGGTEPDVGGDGGADPADMDQAPITGPATAGLLLQLANRESIGTVDPGSVAGQGEPGEETFGRFDLTRDGVDSTLGVNVQDLNTLPAIGRDCAAITWADECHVMKLEDGGRVRTYSSEDKPGKTVRVAEYLSDTEGLRVLVQSTAARGSEETIPWGALIAVAKDRQWGLYVTRATLGLGEGLPSYTDLAAQD